MGEFDSPKGCLVGFSLIVLAVVGLWAIGAIDIPGRTFASILLIFAVPGLIILALIALFSAIGERRLDRDMKQLAEDPAVQKFNQRTEEILRLPSSVAREKARTVLTDPLRFRCRLSVRRHDEIVSILSPVAKEVFSEFDEIATCVEGPAVIGPAFFHQIGGAGFLIEIGGSEDEGAFLRTLSEAVFEGTSEQDLVEAAPTVYHYILLMDLRWNVWDE